MEVLHINVLVRCCLALAPQKQTLLGSHFLNGNILNSETQNDSPDHTERHLQVAINDFLRTDGHQFDTFRCDEVKSFVDVGDLLFTWKQNCYSKI